MDINFIYFRSILIAKLLEEAHFKEKKIFRYTYIAVKDVLFTEQLKRKYYSVITFFFRSKNHSSIF